VLLRVDLQNSRGPFKGLLGGLELQAGIGMSATTNNLAMAIAT
jgi:hypothetical protein